MTPHLSSTPVFGGIINGARATNGKIIQRISPARLSDSVKERRMADADAELVLQSQNGSPAAFEQLVRNHQRMIHSLTFRMTGSLADAEDLAQETFIRAYAQIGTFRGTAKFSSWLYRIAINTCLNWRQSEARRFQLHASCTADAFSSIFERRTSVRRKRIEPAGSGCVAETSRQTARGDCADHLRRPESCRSRARFALLGGHGFVAGVRRP